MNNRIVIAGEFWFGASGSGIAHGFRKLGWECGEVNVRDHMISGRTLALKAAARLLKTQSIASYNAAVLDEVAASRPRAFLSVKGSLLYPQTIAAIRQSGVTTVNYYPDYHFDYAGLDVRSFEHYDLFFTTKSFQVDYLRTKLGADRVRFLHHGYSSLVHRPLLNSLGDDTRTTDILYVGNHSPYKERWMVEIARGVPNAKFAIVGSGWSLEPFKAFPKVTVSPKVVIGDPFAGVLQGAKINISLHSGVHEATGWEDLVSTRTFEIPACKGFMLHIDSPEVRALFEPGAEIDVFTTAEDLTQKIRHYLADPEQRALMVERAYERCVPAYSYDRRAEEIARAIAAVSPPS